MLLPLAVTHGSAAQGDEQEPALEALKRQLESGRHEMLGVGKAHPDIKLEAVSTDGCSGVLFVRWQYLAGNIEHFHTTIRTKGGLLPTRFLFCFSRHQKTSR